MIWEVERVRNIKIDEHLQACFVQRAPFWSDGHNLKAIFELVETVEQC